MKFKLAQKNTECKYQVFIVDDEKKLSHIEGLTPTEVGYVTEMIKNDHSLITVNQFNKFYIVYQVNIQKSDAQTRDTCRKGGADIQPILQKYKAEEVIVHTLSSHTFAATMLAEGLALANYQFLKYKSDAAKSQSKLATIFLEKSAASVKEVDQLNVITEAIYRVRSLVNEPLNHLSAVGLSEAIEAMGKEAGFKVTVLDKAKIQKEKMGGLLAVNAGSIEPPTFTIMEYKPKKCLNKAPIVLVGKGIVFDTGGVSLKPTLNSMDKMKSDMSGAALVSGVMFAVASLGLPLHLIALVPATDNRPGENAYVPGDVITMYSGKTVEVLNTDAEGRMVLADALHWAKRYEPELVMDFATLTGAASAAIGEHGIVCMGTADDMVKKALRESGYRQYERLVEFPMWDEYGEQIKSDVADIKNVGGATGGAITAGKFLEHFIEYPWMHFDIAGVSLSSAKKGYIPSGGTAYGLRMVMDYLLHYGKI